MGVCLSKPAAAEGQVASPPPVKVVAASAETEQSVDKPTSEKASRSSPTSVLADDGCIYRTEAEPTRLQALLDCKCLDTVDERRFDSITSLLKEMFDVPIALVSLIDNDKLVFKSVAGTDCRQGDRLHSFCDASLRAPNPRMMVVPDTLKDPRFQDSQFVKGAPYVRMYSGAPLVSSEGFILGSLGILDVQPRTFAPGALNMVCNFAELVVRELERDKARERAQQSKLETALEARRHMVRALSCFGEAVMLCNVAAEGWPVLWVNENWCSTTGFSEPALLNSAFWDLFHPPLGAAAEKEAALKAAEEHSPFVLTVEGGHCASAVLEMKPATADHLSAAVPTIGIPNFVEGLGPSEIKTLDGYYFAVIKQSTQTAGASGQDAASRGAGSGSGPTSPSAPSSAGQPDRAVPQRASLDYPTSSGASAGKGLVQLVHSDVRSVYSYTRSPFGLTPPGSLTGLKMGPLLGRGAYGKVYRGTWRSAPVAVKIMESWADVDCPQPSRPVLEALLSKNLTHPYTVQTFTYAVHIFEPDSEDDEEQASAELAGPGHADGSLGSGQGPKPPGRRQQQVWIVQQYCNHGTLGDAVDRGWLREHAGGKAGAGGPNLWAVLPTAQEIASAIQYLHSEGVIHGDLSTGNVLLTGVRHMRRRDPRSFQAKVGDFGLATLMSEASSAKGSDAVGTMSHVPLEVIESGLLTPAADAYAWGTLVWEMLSGQRAWAGLSGVQILTARTVHKRRLEVPACCPPGLRPLLEACVSDNPSQRPSFDDIVATLDRLIEEAEAAADAAPPVSPSQ